jgi:uncharacterized protein YjaG (DUF416 family)
MISSIRRLLTLQPALLRPFLKFSDKDPKSSLQEALDNFKKDLKKKKEEMNEDDNNYHKYLIGVVIYLVGCVGMYELKRQRALPITHEDVMTGIKKGSITQIVVAREVKKDEESSEEEKKNNKQKGTNARTVYLTQDGVDYVCYVP